MMLNADDNKVEDADDEGDLLSNSLNDRSNSLTEVVNGGLHLIIIMVVMMVMLAMMMIDMLL